jgi:hypothetical protein
LKNVLVLMDSNWLPTTTIFPSGWRAMPASPAGGQDLLCPVFGFAT